MSPLSLFKCLSDSTRLNLLLLLEAHKELCVCDFTAALQLSQPKVSRHLADLRRCKLVTDERRGKWVYYRLHPALSDWVKTIIEYAAANKDEDTREALKRLTTPSAC